MSFKINNFHHLQPISRKKHRKKIRLNYINLPFIGRDIWTLYELSWLNKNGLPKVAIAKIEIDINSINIVESKSLKTYINSFNQIQFDNDINFIKILTDDLTKCVCGQVSVKLFSLDEIKKQKISDFRGTCIDNQNIKIESYKYDPSLLMIDSKKKITKESLYTHLFKSNCPATQQPDWASMYITYIGLPINHDSLLRYLISFRSHNEFHEECIERIFNDINKICKPEKLTVYGRYTRRGGIDINPWRSNTIFSPCFIRLARQ
ncbi:NADPH-dependent 7-cyano-7-deazaguanine reductase QueF [Buchnera aphidicola]|uniref:NADPH-dependent 7-cyano-7-deazaguanine reductase n=1 Tax=Buchnera aphidicola subsp. Rhopalosiphum maidis TaxID=118109 RepID=A0A3G2I5X3_BUCRM|nr:NADPH-dependent 7-cyano-7-deazaguanine reductase QueF [Buchnera aphidicola]AYN24767.1 NADPH-dependent 7-cyano-7-deazaguanine reductase QueF [Buchnera aphidicola (Rhopalosiphum maidis)]